MVWTIIGVVVLFAVLVVLIKTLQAKGLLHVAEPERAKHPFKKKDYFFSKGERVFYDVLMQAVDGQVAVFAMVRLWDLLDLPKGTEQRQSHQNRVQSKHVDFVLCDLKNLSPALVIELDDKSHGRARRVERDKLVDEIPGDAGLPILHVKAAPNYDPQALRQSIQAKLRPEEVAAQA
jgi:very-short-patch-repair endonuclease